MKNFQTIAEIGSNWGGNEKTGKKMIKAGLLALLSLPTTRATKITEYRQKAVGNKVIRKSANNNT